MIYKTGLVVHMQPVYEHETKEGAYLYCSLGGNWHVGNDYTTDSAWFYSTSSPFTPGPAQWHEDRAGGWTEVIMGIAANVGACYSCTSPQPGSFLDKARSCCVSAQLHSRCLPGLQQGPVPAPACLPLLPPMPQWANNCPDWLHLSGQLL